MIVWHQSPAFDVSCANEYWHVTIMYVVWKVKEDGHLLAYQQRGALIWLSHLIHADGWLAMGHNDGQLALWKEETN